MSSRKRSLLVFLVFLRAVMYTIVTVAGSAAAQVLEPARPPRQSLALYGTSAAEAPSRGRGEGAAALPAHPPEVWRRAARAPGRPTALPQAAPPSPARGTCWGISIRWAGKPAHCFGCGQRRRPPIPNPFPEERGRAHPRRPWAERGSPYRRWTSRAMHRAKLSRLQSMDEGSTYDASEPHEPESRCLRASDRAHRGGPRRRRSAVDEALEQRACCPWSGRRHAAVAPQRRALSRRERPSALG